MLLSGPDLRRIIPENPENELFGKAFRNGEPPNRFLANPARSSPFSHKIGECLAVFSQNRRAARRFFTKSVRASIFFCEIGEVPAVFSQNRRGAHHFSTKSVRTSPFLSKPARCSPFSIKTGEVLAVPPWKWSGPAIFSTIVAFGSGQAVPA